MDSCLVITLPLYLCALPACPQAAQGSNMAKRCLNDTCRSRASVARGMPSSWHFARILCRSSLQMSGAGGPNVEKLSRQWSRTEIPFYLFSIGHNRGETCSSLLGTGPFGFPTSGCPALPPHVQQQKAGGCGHGCTGFIPDRCLPQLCQLTCARGCGVRSRHGGG